MADLPNPAGMPRPGNGDTYTQQINNAVLAPPSNVWQNKNPGALDCDVSYGHVHRFTLLAGGTYTVAVTNAADGRHLQLMLNTVSGTFTVNWPANFRFHSDTAPTVAGSKVTCIEFRYDATLDRWIEQQRSIITY